MKVYDLQLVCRESMKGVKVYDAKMFRRAVQAEEGVRLGLIFVINETKILSWNVRG